MRILVLLTAFIVASNLYAQGANKYICLDEGNNGECYALQNVKTFQVDKMYNASISFVDEECLPVDSYITLKPLGSENLAYYVYDSKRVTTLYMGKYPIVLTNFHGFKVQIGQGGYICGQANFSK